MPPFTSIKRIQKRHILNIKECGNKTILVIQFIVSCFDQNEEKIRIYSIVNLLISGTQVTAKLRCLRSEKLGQRRRTNFEDSRKILPLKTISSDFEKPKRANSFKTLKFIFKGQKRSSDVMYKFYL